MTDENARIIARGSEDKAPRNSKELETCFKNSADRTSNLLQIAAFEDEINDRQAGLHSVHRRTIYALPFYKQVRVCTIRQFQVLWGDKFTFFAKFGLTILQSLIFGSLFYNQPATSSGVFTRGGVILYFISHLIVADHSFSLFFNALLALSELTNAYSARPILLKHKLFAFYRPAAYALAQLATDIPIIFVQVSCFDLVVYFLTNLSRTPSQFFINFLVLYITTMTMYAFFRMVGALSSSLDVATRVSGLSIQVLVVYAGISHHIWLIKGI